MEQLLKQLKDYFDTCQKDLSSKKKFAWEMRSELGVEWFHEHKCREKWNGRSLTTGNNAILLTCFQSGYDWSLDKWINETKLESFLSRRGYMKTSTPPPPQTTTTESTNQTTTHMETKAMPTTTYDNTEKKVNAGFTLNLDLAALVGDGVKEYIEGSGLLNNVEQRIKEEAAKLNPTVVMLGEIKMGETKQRPHKKFTDLVKKVHLEKQALLVGPAGTGKSTLAKQVAESLGLPFASISCTAGMSEAHLTGRMAIDGSYIRSEFVKFYEEGGVFLLDEVDAADNNTMLIINSALANGFMSVSNRVDNQIAKRHSEFICIAAANTTGDGATSQYAGRNQIDGAFMDRFVGCKIEVNYDTELEANILQSFPLALTTLNRIRENVVNHKIRRIVSTRAYISASKSISYDTEHEKLNQANAVKQYLDTFFIGWTNEERKKAMDGVTI